MNSRPEGTQDLNARPALLPERENYAASVPAVSPQANLRRASGAEDFDHTFNRLPRSVSHPIYRDYEKVSPLARQLLLKRRLVAPLFEHAILSPPKVTPMVTQLLKRREEYGAEIISALGRQLETEFRRGYKVAVYLPFWA
jgi:hypothetical protein